MVKRNKKTTVYVVPEGHREIYFLKYLEEIYDPRANGVSIITSTLRGGTPESIINDALRNQHYKKVYAWFDEDTPLIKDEDDEENYYIFDH